MKRTSFTRMIIVVAAVAGLGCAAKPPPPPDGFQAVELDAFVYEPGVESFVVVLDASSSMNEEHAGLDKFVTAKRTAAHLNQTLPGLDFQSGLVAFGSGECLEGEDARSLHGLAAHNPVDFDTGLTALGCAGGTTPMFAGLELAQEKLEQSSGPVAVLLVSDAQPLQVERALDVVRALEATHGDRLCLYPIQVGASEDGAALMEEIAAIGNCGFVTQADALASPDAMAAYVARVFLRPVTRARFTAAPVVDRDADLDGVPDRRDRCPRTPRGVHVNASGCWEFKGLRFAFDSAVIENPSSLDEVVRILVANPGITGEVRGYTDGVGSAAYNLELSRARASAVRAYLLRRGIAPSRIRAVGRGMADPVASNATAEGRAMNRRVELEPDR